MNSVLREALLEHKRGASSTSPEDHVFLAWKGSPKGEAPTLDPYRLGKRRRQG